MVKWSEPARQDLRHIHDFIALDSHHYAKKVIEEILDKSITLEDSPLRGRIVPEIENTNIREVFVYSYRLIYEITGDLIYVLAVIHGKRDMSSMNLKNYRE
ncbi:type II toxin-antitoxin system RelE/ParE family toxin [bacterium]|nr:type II toxin-antitoxin system RelE/ParE family toxin [bacterium]